MVSTAYQIDCSLSPSPRKSPGLWLSFLTELQCIYQLRRSCLKRSPSMLSIGCAFLLTPLSGPRLRCSQVQHKEEHAQASAAADFGAEWAGRCTIHMGKL
eukprot:1195892-Prorocentrum_minimum.AAC.2